MIVCPDNMPRRNIDVDFVIDTNRINARKSLKMMNHLERWHRDGVVGLVISETARAECSSSMRAEKASDYIFTKNKLRAPEEYDRLRKISDILFPGIGAKCKNEENDVLIVFNAGKYGDILLTADGASKRQPGGILGKRTELAALGIRVMTDSEAVAFVEGLIRSRDERAREVARRTGLALPD